VGNASYWDGTNWVTEPVDSPWDSNAVVFVQPSAPTGAKQGDLFIDSVTSYPQYNTGSAWSNLKLPQTGVANLSTDLAAINSAVALKAPIASPTFTGTVGGITKSMVGLANVDNTTDLNKPVSTAQQTALDLKIKYGDVLQNTNPFGGKKLYINNINNAAFRAQDRWTVTGGFYSSADDSLVTNKTGALQNAFDGDYESQIVIPLGQYLKFNINNPSYFYGYPYGYFYNSFYYTGIPQSVSMRVYCNYVPQTVGWKALTTDTISNGASSWVSRSRNDFYQLSDIEVTIVSPAAGNPTSLTQFEWQLDRPMSGNDMPILDKYKANTLYNSLNLTAGNQYKINNVALAKGDVGLGNVDNTTDLLKPVSTATQTALNLKANLASPTFTGTVGGIDKTMVGLSAVDNTSDVNKPVSTAQATAIGLKADKASPTFTGTITAAAANFTGAVTGIDKSEVGLSNVDNTTDLLKPLSTAATNALNLKANTASPTFTGTVGGIDKTMVGLGNVDNTSDANKPVSTSQQNALNLKANLASPAFTGTPTGIIRVESSDGDRNAATKLPTTTPKGVRFDFVSSSSAGTGGTYAGLMTYGVWDGTTVSTGDASYQLAFGSTATNGGGIPQLNIRKGIDSTWNSWYTILHTGSDVISGTIAGNNYYEKYANGQLICRGMYVFPTGDQSYTWTYPVAFVGQLPQIITNHGTTAPESLSSSHSSDALTSVIIEHYRSSAGSTTMYFAAMGRWR